MVFLTLISILFTIMSSGLCIDMTGLSQESVILLGVSASRPLSWGYDYFRPSCKNTLPCLFNNAWTIKFDFRQLSFNKNTFGLILWYSVLSNFREKLTYNFSDHNAFEEREFSWFLIFLTQAERYVYTALYLNKTFNFICFCCLLKLSNVKKQKFIILKPTWPTNLILYKNCSNEYV